MAFNRGALLASTYQLPQAQPQAPIQQSPFQDEIGDPAAGLQQIDGVTDEYFQKWAALKGFARDVQENLGVDVRYPDPSIPGSERLHRIYLKSLADLKAQGERLKTGQQMYMADRQRGALISGDPRQQYYDKLNVGTDIVDTDLDPIVAEANKKLQGPHFGASIKEAEAYRNNVLKMLEARRNNDPKNAGYWQRQIDSVIEPVQAIREFDPDKGGYTRYQHGRINAAASFLRKMTNLQKGTAASYKLSDTIIDPENGRAYVSEDTKGEQFGGGKVVRHEYYPKTKKSLKVIQLPDGSIKKLDMSDVDPMTHAKGYLDNSRYAANGEYLDIAADELGYFTNEGEVNYKNLLSSDSEDIYKAQEKESSNEEANKTVDLSNKLMGMLKQTKPGLVWDDTITLKIKGGKSVKIEANPDGKGGTSYEVLDLNKTFPGIDAKGKAALKSMSLEQLHAWLLKQDAHLLLEDSGTKSAPSKSADPLGKVVPSIDPAEEAKRLLEQYRNQKK